MKGLVYLGEEKYGVEERPKPQITGPTDAIVKLRTTTICGSDLHILRGDVSTCEIGRILGHEGVGIIESVGASVVTFKPGDRVLIPSITACATCEYCRRQMPSHCTSGGWILGNEIDGTHAEYVRIPLANTSLHAAPPDVSDRALVMLSDLLTTGMECGTLAGKVSPGSVVAIVGMGPVGICALMTAQLFSPSMVICIDLDPYRLEVAQRLGATHILESGPDVVENVMKLTKGRGVDTAMEAVGVPAAFSICQSIVGIGGTIANIGVHGCNAELQLAHLWNKNISITMRVVDGVTTSTLIGLLQSGRLDTSMLATHTFKFSDVEKAYSSFAAAAQCKALKVIIEFE